MYTDLWIMFWLACTFVGPMHAQRRGASAMNAWLLCVALGPVGVWLSLTLSPVASGNEAHKGGLLGTMAEIGERKRLEAMEARAAKLEAAAGKPT